MPTNHAAYLTEFRSPLKVQEAPFPTPTTTQLLIRTRALAINPVDWGSQAMGDRIFPWMKPPFVLGSDLAGEVISTGPSVTMFKPGDRVVCQALGYGHNDNSEGAFQEYVIVAEEAAAKIPNGLKYEDAAVLPLGLSTAAFGLFQKSYLALDPPSLESKAKGEWLLIWGGSTSVGCNAIQLATVAGYDVVTTASPKNFDLVKSLGAKKVFDHNSPKAVEDIIFFLKDKKHTGAYAIGSPLTPNNGAGAGQECLKIVQKTEGVKFVAMAMHGPAEMAPEGVKAKFSQVEGDFEKNEVARMIFGDFLPRALEAGKFVCKPDALVVGHGLERLQEAFEVQKGGLSARKVVITL